jgi:hypothetical protein
LAPIAGLIVLYLQLRADYDLCEVAEPQVITGPRGDKIEMDSRFCSALAGDPGTIVVHFRPAGSDSRRIIFAYNPTTPSPGLPNPPWYPKIAWTAPNRVLISTSRISHIQRQGDGEGDTRFIYQIGKVDYP